MNDHKNMVKTGFLREASRQDAQAAQKQHRAVSGSSSTTAKMRQMMKQQTDLQQYKHLAGNSRVHTLQTTESYNPVATQQSANNDTSLQGHTPENYSQSVGHASLPVSGKNQTIAQRSQQLQNQPSQQFQAQQ